MRRFIDTLNLRPDQSPAHNFLDTKFTYLCIRPLTRVFSITSGIGYFLYNSSVYNLYANVPETTENTITVLDRLKAIGVQPSIDDFDTGTGASDICTICHSTL